MFVTVPEDLKFSDSFYLLYGAANLVTEDSIPFQALIARVILKRCRGKPDINLDMKIEDTIDTYSRFP